jgi:ABC-type transport system involved in multi-copper enzyme maturation permease subunit
MPQHTWRSLRSIFSLFFPAGRKARKTKVFFAIGCLPVLMALIIKLNQVFFGGRTIEGMAVFSNIIMAFYLQFLILILALFFGSSVCLEEIEGKTLTYLTTRPVSKSGIVLGKYTAYVLIIVAMVAAGVIFSFLILNFEDLLDLSIWKVLASDLAVLALGLICYTAFFAFLGTFFKRSILFGLVFAFGWENVVQYFPGATQRFTIVHYLKSLLPGGTVTTSGRFAFLLFRLEPSSPLTAIVTLLMVTAVFLGLACLFFSQKEYLFEE